jgi:hypothetical protein
MRFAVACRDLKEGLGNILSLGDFVEFQRDNGAHDDRFV